MNTVDVVIMAGGSAEAISPGLGFKGLVPILGRPMVEWVVDALRKSPVVGKIVVTVPTGDDLGAWTEKVDEIVVVDLDFADNVLAGLDACDPARHALLCTGDLPALLPEAVDDFVHRSLQAGADFSYPLIAQEDMEKQFPGSQRTYFLVDGGKFTGGNVMLVSPGHAGRARETGQQLFEMRKHPLKLVSLAGPGLLYRFARGKMTVEELQAKAGEALGGRVVALKTTYASLGADVDKPVDVEVAEAVLSRIPVSL